MNPERFIPQSPAQKPFENSQDSSLSLQGIERQKFIDSIYESGRAVFHTNIMDTKLLSLTGLSNYGWSIFRESRLQHTKLDYFATRFEFPPSKEKILKTEKVNAVVSIEPAKVKVPVMEPKKTIQVVRGGLFGLSKKNVESNTEIKVGTREESLKMSELIQGAGDLPTYHVSYFRFMQPKWSTPRPGVNFSVSIILPEQPAKELMASVKADPSLIREIIRRFHPRVMEYMEADNQFPPDNRLLVVPEGVDPFERSEKKYVQGRGFVEEETGIKSEFIVEAKN